MGRASRRRRESAAAREASRTDPIVTTAGTRTGGAVLSPWTVPWPLAWILLAAALFRAVYFQLYASNSIFFDGLILDSELYHSWAVAVSTGQWLGSEPFYHPPLYPYTLALIFQVFGPSLAAAFLLQALLGLVNLVLIYRIAATLFSSRVGVIATAGAALYGPFAFFETKLLSTTLGLTLNLVALLVLVLTERAHPRPATGGGGRGRWFGPHARRWFGAGMTIGIAALCRPATVLLAPLYAAARARRDPWSSAAILVGAFAGLLPILAHNLYVAGDPLLLSAQGGVTFYQGNREGAAGLYSIAPGFSGSPVRQAAEEKAIAERETGRSLRRSEISTHFFGKGFRSILNSPGRWIALEFRKLGYLIGDYEASTEYSIYLEREDVPWQRIAFLPFAVIMGAGVAGLILVRFQPPAGSGGTALRIYTLAAAAIPLMFFVSSRYRLPLVPALLIYGAVFVERLSLEIRGGRGLQATTARTLILALLLAFLSFLPLGHRSETAEGNVFYNIGNLLAAESRHEEAVEAFDRSLIGWRGNAYAWINRGNSLDKLGRTEEAMASYRLAEEVRPGFWTAYKAQGVILHRQQRLVEAAEVYRRGVDAGGAEAHFLLATTLSTLGRDDEAGIEFRLAIETQTDDPRFHNSLANLLERRGRAAEAIEEYRIANRVGPRYTKSRYNLATLLARRNENDEAEVLLLEALRIDPGYVRAHVRLGEIYEQRGDVDAARSHFQSALRIDPGERTARNGLSRLLN